MTPTKITKPLFSTWQGRKGCQQMYHFDSSKTGKRLVVHRWLDGSNEVSVRAIKGDFWKNPSKAVCFEEVKLSLAPTDSLPEGLLERLAKHF